MTLKKKTTEKANSYDKMYRKIFKTLGTLTPLKADCGCLCDGACCKGDGNTGMRLFPNEPTSLPTKKDQNGCKLVVCSGSCGREERPLACRIFPLFPTIADNGKIYPEIDYRGYTLCPMVEHCDDVLFDKSFIKAVKRVGKLLSRDSDCRDFLKEQTEEIDLYYKLFCSRK